jgi:hypothetical protein
VPLGRDQAGRRADRGQRRPGGVHRGAGGVMGWGVGGGGGAV